MAESTITLRKRPLPLAASLFALVFCVFLPCLQNDFSNFDDPVYLIWNPHVHSSLTWRSIQWAFTSFYAANWHPITWLSHMLDIQLFKAHASGHHLTAILFHSANVALLAIILIEATGSFWRSAIVALLFGIHPLHVESVAWIAERKDVLNTFFSLLTLIAYVQWTRAVNRKAKIWYFSALLCYALSLASKAMSVTLPILLLLLDYWPLGRLGSRPAVWRSLVEKIPFVIMAVAVAAVTVAAQAMGGAIKMAVPLWMRGANAIVSVVRYVLKFIWPHDLSVFYPYTVPAFAIVLLSFLFFLAVSTAVIVWRRKFPWLFMGWWWFVISLLPVIGIIQIGTQAMADRYMYWPSIGPLIAAVWAGAWIAGRFRIQRMAVALATSVVVLAATAVTEHQISFWKNGETLFRHALAVTHDNSMAELNLGVALGDRAAYDEALIHLREAVRIAPQFPEAHLNLGMALHQNGQLAAAVSEFKTAIRLLPEYSKAHANLAIALQEQNDFDGAIKEYRQALRLDPISPDVRVGYGLALQRAGQIYPALAEFDEAIKEDSSYAGAHSNRGIVLEKLERFEEAISEYRKALSLDPKNGDAALNLPVTLFKAGHVDDAIGQARNLIKQRPDYPDAYFNLGGMLFSKNDFDGAIEAYKHALRLKPDYADARHNLNVALDGKSAKADQK